MPKIARPASDLEKELGVQLRLLEKSCNEFDRGDIDEYRRIAVSVRVLLHDTNSSHSLAGKLNIKNVPFQADGGAINPRNLMAEWPLAIIRVGDGKTKFIPMLGSGPFPRRGLSFNDWWTEIVFKSPDGVNLNRKGFILHTANQAGGAHVDDHIDEAFNAIAKENAVGLVSVGDSGSVPIEHIEKAYVRHIGHEVLVTLRPEWKRIEGNLPCHCGTGRKFRYCHGK